MLQSWDMGQILLLSPPEEGMLRIFLSVKIQRLRPGLNPQTWVPEASMLTTRPPKPSKPQGKLTGQDITQLTVEYDSDVYSFV